MCEQRLQQHTCKWCSAEFLVHHDFVPCQDPAVGVIMNGLKRYQNPRDAVESSGHRVRQSVGLDYFIEDMCDNCKHKHMTNVAWERRDRSPVRGGRS